jgi:membrane-bound ClpP family serine protease
MPQERKGIVKSNQRSYFREYNFEITVIILIALGTFLIVEDLEIKTYIYRFIKGFFFGIGNIIKLIQSGTIFVISQFETSDLVGISLILLAVFLIVKRWRDRIIERHSILSECPNCSGHLVRTHRELNHKIMSFIYFATVKRYHCKACSYTGIKLVKR